MYFWVIARDRALFSTKFEWDSFNFCKFVPKLHEEAFIITLAASWRSIAACIHFSLSQVVLFRPAAPQSAFWLKISTASMLIPGFYFYGRYQRRQVAGKLVVWMLPLHEVDCLLTWRVCQKFFACWLTINHVISRSIWTVSQIFGLSLMSY